MIINKVVLVE